MQAESEKSKGKTFWYASALLHDLHFFYTCKQYFGPLINVTIKTYKTCFTKSSTQFRLEIRQPPMAAAALGE